MSDGDNATPGRHGQDGSSAPDGPSDTNKWRTRSARPAPGAAPWERAGVSDDDASPASPPGNHTDGISVADLIAKLHGDRAVPSEIKRHRSPADDASGPPPTEIIDAVPAAPVHDERSVEPVYPDLTFDGPTYESPAYEDPAYHGEDADSRDADSPDTEIIPVVGARGSELPDLSLAHRPSRVPPSHFGTGRRRPDQGSPRRSRRKSMVVGRVVTALIAVLALALTGGAWQWQSAKNNMLNRISALDPDSRDILDPNAQFGDENFLIVGVDSRMGENVEMGAGTTDEAAGARSDTVMLVNIPANRERVVAVSFPRDLAIEPMQCEPWDPKTGEYGPITDPESPMYGADEVYTEYKLNSAYAVGGPKCLVKVIQKMSGLYINRFMAVDFAGFSKMVDALGGVEVCSTTPLEDYELGTVLPTAGRQRVDGHTALQYVRARQVTTETNGDYGRIKRQQLFLSSLLRSMISREVFFSLSKLNNVVNMFINDSYVDNMDTKDLVTLGQSVQGIAAGRITFLTVPTTGYMDEYGNEHLREEDNRAIFDAIINDDPLPEEKNADNTPVPGTPESQTQKPSQDAAAATELVDTITTNPSDVTVQVSNSTGEDGLGATAADELQTHGFNVVSPDDHPGPVDTTTVFFSPGNEQAAATVASAFPNSNIERATNLGDVIQVVLGSDFHSVSSPPSSGSPVQVHVAHDASSTPTNLPEDLTVTNAADTTCE
ncbi:cell envelope-related function transcriptional attenuator common domain protein [Mycolicibacterium rhodesiae NBB3]|uniref:Cell envelope-related function transcriptional attenuator common domain protein n=1 Tax=Mycolicibacterium rhodesiae (strain NBB3) TaxID=710685 RepID=G8RXB2_MYCRN|nr:LCP family protein [Mycolicibacterium rhodesiae]AEV73160.1 cell envelope-related function transcriptional attenuator common domain protein [Mycolicibacterium rhodesiae NBB3]